MKRNLVFVLLSFIFQVSYAQPEPVQLSVWVNEAIVATYTYNYKSYLNDQKGIAKYFTADAWIDFVKALNESKLPDAIQKNQYDVTAVATDTPVITSIDPTHWQATMKLLVVYQNPQYQQKQNLKVTIKFMVASSGQGVRGYSITNFESVKTSPPCKCQVEPQEEKTTPIPMPTITPNNAKP